MNSTKLQSRSIHRPLMISACMLLQMGGLPLSFLYIYIYIYTCRDKGDRKATKALRRVRNTRVPPQEKPPNFQRTHWKKRPCLAEAIKKRVHKISQKHSNNLQKNDTKSTKIDQQSPSAASQTPLEAPGISELFQDLDL